ncbi:MAG: glycosyltransferase [Nostocaceae cyanobacterium]|nr:glycosyltransferase [Nostocaceae cyanobacterium]
MSNNQSQKNNHIQIDIITLTKNSDKCILETLHSVNSQDYPHIHHIIIDGNSTDKTIPIINQYHHKKKLSIFQQHGSGIANGLNTGLIKSSGELVIFLNSGDSFVSESVLSKIVDSYVKEKWLWAFGETISRSRKGYFTRHIKQYKTWQQSLFLYKNPICHQSTVFSQEILQKNGLYDEKLSLEMDYDFNVRASLLSQPFLLHFPISYYDTTGVSSRHVFKYYKIHKKLRKKYFSLSPISNLKIDSICLIKAILRFLMIPVKLYL